jgi:hypothetical protein
MDLLKCQTSAASPAKPKELPCWFRMDIMAARDLCDVRPRRQRLLTNCAASQNMTHVPFEPARTTWTSWERSCDCYDQALMECRDRVGDVTLGPDRQRRGVGNHWEWQVF